ncbi:hypothetical protein B0H10DRAFT_1960634 [Mycena sp. CBHHK59/15]|nr:hypothetical protein B0H10DRAFT_1960634 [Mycena sp. CBHHK59/15]
MKRKVEEGRAALMLAQRGTARYNGRSLHPSLTSSHGRLSEAPPIKAQTFYKHIKNDCLLHPLLKLDRLSAGPERDIDALKRRSDEMVAAAVARVRARENEHPGQPSDATSLKRRRHGQAANQEASSHDRVPTPSPEQVVATVRKALRPLHSALLVQANTLSAGVTHDNDKDSDKGNDKSNNKGDENGSNTVARARQFKAWLQGMGAPPEGFGAKFFNQSAAQLWRIEQVVQQSVI